MQITELIKEWVFIKCMLCTRYCFQHFPPVSWFGLNPIPMMQVELLSHLYRGENWGPEKWGNSPKVSQLGDCRTEIWTQNSVVDMDLSHHGLTYQRDVMSALGRVWVRSERLLLCLSLTVWEHLGFTTKLLKESVSLQALFSDSRCHKE